MPSRKNMEGVDDGAHGGMIRAAHHFPPIPVVRDMPAPSQCLEPSPQTPLGSSDPEFVKILGSATNAAHPEGRNIAAHQKEVGAQLLHQTEFRSRRSKVRVRCGSGMPSKSLNG